MSDASTPEGERARGMHPDYYADEGGEHRGERIVVPRISWKQHRSWLDHNWKAGQHVSVVTKTGGGKSYLVRNGLHPLWIAYRTLIFDLKGDDETLAGWGEPVDGYPGREIQAEDEAQRGERTYRLLVPEFEFNPEKHHTEGLKKARRVAGMALDRTYKEGKWLVILDETQPFADNQNAFGLGLQGLLRQIWQRGRSREVTLIACTQEPLWMPGPFYSQCSFIYIGQEVDPKAEHLQSIGGSQKAIRAGIEALEEHEFLFVSRTPREYAIVKVTPPT